MNDELRDDQQRHRDQEAHVRLDVAQERHAFFRAPHVSLEERQREQRQPRNPDDRNGPMTKQFEFVTGEMRTAEQLEQRTAEDQRKILRRTDRSYALGGARDLLNDDGQIFLRVQGEQQMPCPETSRAAAAEVTDPAGVARSRSSTRIGNRSVAPSARRAAPRFRAILPLRCRRDRSRQAVRACRLGGPAARRRRSAPPTRPRAASGTRSPPGSSPKSTIRPSTRRRSAICSSSSPTARRSFTTSEGTRVRPSRASTKRRSASPS